MIPLYSNWVRFSIVVMIVAIASECTAAGGMVAATASDSGYTQWDVVLLITYILLALVFSFLCSVAEAVLLSITPSYIAGLRDKKPKLAALLKQLKQDNVDQSLAAILTLNTIAHTVGAIGSGSKATVVFGSAWFGLFSAIMTLMILFLSEIIPKTIGAVYWRGLAGLTARFVRALIWALYPLIRISEALTRLIARGKTTDVFSREEFVAMAGIGERAGKIDPHESRIIQNLFRLGSLTASDIMTPRTVISGLPQDISVTAALDARPSVTLSTLKRDIKTVPGIMPLSHLLEFLLDQRQHIAVVVDEYGGTKGLVTTEDVVETLLGMEIVDEMDRVEDMRALARRQWKKRAKALGLQGNADDQEPVA